MVSYIPGEVPTVGKDCWCYTADVKLGHSFADFKAKKYIADYDL